jgi:hypothetical protein
MHDTEGGVVQHMFMSKDEKHADVDNKGDAWGVIRDNDSSQGDGTNDNNTGETESGSQSASDGGHPKDDVPPADPKEPDTGGSDGHELPCGHHTVTEDDLPEPPFHVIVTCETCGTDYEVKA